MHSQVEVKPNSRLAIIAVGLNFNNDTQEAQKSFMESKQYEWNSGFDAGGSLAQKAGIVGVPTAIVVDPQGKIVTFGHYRDDWAKRLDQFLRQACVAQK